MNPSKDVFVKKQLVADEEEHSRFLCRFGTFGEVVIEEGF